MKRYNLILICVVFMVLSCLCACGVTPQTATVVEKLSGNLEVHYLDVGQADATLLICGENTMLIDGGNAEDSSLIYAYLKEHNIEHLDYMVCTHAHEDHVGGLAGALNCATVGAVYCPVTNYDSRAFDSFLKYLSKQSLEITIPTVGTEFMLGEAKCTVLAVNSSAEDDPNNTSIAMKVEFGSTSFLFSGDAEYSVESSIIDSGFDIRCTVMKVPHHGSETSTSYRWLWEAQPQYGVISVGTDNSYGHPTEATLSRLRDADVTVYRTDLNGHVICTSDGNDVSFSVEKFSDAIPTPKPNMNTTNTPAITVTPDVVSTMYVLNTNSKKIHYPTCPSVEQTKVHNRQETNLSKEELYAQGYTSCGNCKP